MADKANAEKAPGGGWMANLQDWFAGLKAEFGKIIWPAREILAKQTAAVIAVSVVLGLIIAILDKFIQYGIDFLVKL